MMSEFCKVYVSPSLFVVLVRAAECVSKRVCVSCFGDKNAFDRNAVTNNLNFQIHRGPFYVRRFGLNRFSLRQ